MVVGITGASGILYGVKLLHLLRALKVESHLVLTRAARLTIPHETDLTAREIASLADVTYGIGDVAASISSGSFITLGMIVAPCSIRTLSEIATGTTSSLLTRAADVTLKERRRLVLMVRETPLTLGHIRAMAAATENGAIIAPPVPAFYTRPVSLDDIITHTVARTLDLFGLDAGMSRWGEEAGDIQEPRYGSRLADETNS
jgi:4-hydroxy-3-polyprenylbenzoate decarboxylase